jgi:RNA recognition motif-containing protein
MKLYCGNLSFSETESSVRELFAAHGAVLSLALPADRETGAHRGFGFIEMSDTDAAKAMHALDGKEVSGRVLKVNIARERTARRES